jgi:hypothetical protein
MNNAISRSVSSLVWGTLCLLLAFPTTNYADELQELAYVELEGIAEEFREVREWASYYWRDDFTFVLRDDAGKTHRVISREPTPWNDLRLGTTYPGLKVDWAAKPRVKVIGVAGIDRTPVEFYELKLDPKNTVTAFIVRVQQGQPPAWRDFYINNWFHHWGREANMKILQHYATDDPNYTVYGYLGGIAAPLDAASQKLVDQAAAEWSGIIYHGRVTKAANDAGYELRLSHLMGRNKKTLEYSVFHGDPKQLVPLDVKRP